MIKLKYIVSLCCFYYACSSTPMLFAACSDNGIGHSADTPMTPEPDDSDFQKTCDVILGRIKTANMGTNAQYLNENAVKWLSVINEQGAFPDIDYKDRSLGFKPEAHIDRLTQMVQAYIFKECDVFGKAELQKAIAKGLSFWITEKPTCDNWWNNQISVPQKMGVILILSRYGAEPLSPELENKIFDYMIETASDPAKHTGANKTDVALHWLYRGLLQQDRDVIKTAVTHTFMPLSYVNSQEEGIQYDLGYFQHGPQTYIGGYGPVMLSGVMRVAEYTAGTEYRMSAEQQEILYRFVNETYARSFRSNIQFFNIVGRSVSRPNSLKSSGLANLFERMKKIDPNHAEDYDRHISYIQKGNYAGIKETLTHYNIGDWTLFQGENYSACLRLASNRTRKIEHGNNENIKSFFMSDGSIDVGVKGGEYLNIFPVWDWNRVPGVTNPQMEDQIPLCKGWGEPGESDFCGGLSDGKNGLSGFKMLISKYGVQISGYKSWFFMDGAIICLGSGISSPMSQPVNTTVDQCLLRSDAVYSSSGNIATASNGSSLTNVPIDWFWHGDIGYFFPEKQQVSFKLENRSGSWKDINKGKSDEIINQDVCTLWLNHGTTPSNSTYSYIIVPKIAQNDMSRFNVQDYRIVANCSDVQAVTDGKNKLLQALFYQAGSVSTDELKVTVDKPCALMIQEMDGKSYKLFFSDPSQRLNQLTITIEVNGKKGQYTFDQFAGDGVSKGKTHQTVLTLK